MRILVTGASGYLGGHLIRLLADDHDVVAFSRRQGPWLPSGAERPGVTWREGDIRNSGDVRAALKGVELVIHLAGAKQLTADPASVWAMVETNVVATQGLLNEARAAGVERLVFASSYKVYGRQGGHELPSTEASELRPSEPYGWSKALAEQLITQSGIRALILRLSNVFGFGADRVASREVVWSMVDAAFQRATIEVEGTGEQTLDLIAVDDACTAIRRLSESASVWGETVNLGSGTAVSVHALAQMVASTFQELYGQEIAIRRVPASDHTPAHSRAISVDRLGRYDTLRPRVSLEEAIRFYVKEHERSLVT